MRQALPNRRDSEIFDLVHDGQRFTVSVGRFEDGRLAEIFVDARKASSALADAARDAAVLASVALQYGAPADVIRHAVARNSEGQAAGVLGAALDRIGGAQ